MAAIDSTPVSNVNSLNYSPKTFDNDSGLNDDCEEEEEEAWVMMPCCCLPVTDPVHSQTLVTNYIQD